MYGRYLEISCSRLVLAGISLYRGLGADPVGTVRKIFDFGAGRARCAAPPVKNRDACPRLAPNLLEVGVERALMKCLTLVRDAHRALFQRVYLGEKKYYCEDSASIFQTLDRRERCQTKDYSTMLSTRIHTLDGSLR
jgi:hypothetical protein